MRNGFGRRAVKLRLERGMTQSEFAAKMSVSLARVSNIEHSKTNISDDVVGRYIQILNCTGQEAIELRKLANFANSSRAEEALSGHLAPLRAMFAEYGDRISQSSQQRIAEIIERETGEKVSSLAFSSNRRIGRASKKSKRPNLSLARFVEISLIAKKQRQLFTGDFSKLELDSFLDSALIKHADLDIRCVENTPSFAEGAFALIMGGPNGNTIVVEEDRLKMALKGVHFFRHCIMHEYGHHVLHSAKLVCETEAYFAPQELAKVKPNEVADYGQIEQVVDSIEEAEAECFASMMLVPWDAYLKGTHVQHLASDYGEQVSEVKRYSRFIALEETRDAFRETLWANGERSHPIFRPS